MTAAKMEMADEATGRVPLRPISILALKDIAMDARTS